MISDMVPLTVATSPTEGLDKNKSLSVDSTSLISLDSCKDKSVDPDPQLTMIEQTSRAPRTLRARIYYPH